MELRGRREVAGAERQTARSASSAFYMDIHDLQATVTAGSCSSRVVFNVPKARSQGLRGRVRRGAEPQLRFRHLDELQRSELRSTLTSTDPSGDVASCPASKRGAGCRPCPSSSSRPRPPISGRCKPGALAYVTGTYQHIGSRFTQVGDEDLGTLDLLSFGANTIGGPLTASTFTYDPELPAYDILNLRVGRPSQQVGRVVVRQQRDRRAGAAVARSASVEPARASAI